MVTTTGFRAFISYSHRDAAIARRLHGELESYRVPANLAQEHDLPRRLRPIFLDRAELASAPELGVAIKDALSNSQNLIVICSPDSAKSQWVNQEVLEFQRLGRADRIFCLVIRGEPRDVLPMALRDAEPLAADARTEGDGWRDAKLKLIAGLLNTGLDRLRRREDRLRHRRWLIASSASLVLALAMSVLAANAILASREADTRRGQAESLIGFMLTDLRGRLEPIGRLDVLDEVATQAIDYYKTVDNDDVTERSLSRKALAMQQIGEVRISQGRLDESEAPFRDALSINEKLVQQDPLNPDRLFDLAQSQFWVGYYHWQLAELADAEKYFIGYRDTALKLEPLDGDRGPAEVAFAYSNLGSLHNARKNWQVARENFELAVAQLNRMYEHDRTEPYYIREMAILRSWLASTTLEEGDLREAVAEFEATIALLNSLSGGEENRPLEAKIGDTLQLLGASYISSGRLNDARRVIGESIERYTLLVTRDPDNQHWRRALATAHYHMAAVSFDGGQYLPALDQNTRAHTLMVQVTESSQDPEFRIYAAIIANQRASLALQREDSDAAQNSIAASLEFLAPLELETDRYKVVLAEAFLLRARLESLAGDPHQSASLADAQRLLRAATADSANPDRLYLLAQSLSCSGDSAEAQGITATLRDSGFSNQRIQQTGC